MSFSAFETVRAAKCVNWTLILKASLIWAILNLGGPLILVGFGHLSWQLAKSPRAVLRWLDRGKW